MRAIPSRGLAVCALAALLTLPPTAIADAQLEARVARLERVLRSEAPSELLLEVQQLRQEVQELRGQVETQQHALERLREGAGEGPAGAASANARGGGTLDLSPPSGGWRTAGDAPGGRGGSPAAGAAGGAAPSASQVATLPSPETSGRGERQAYQGAFALLKERRYEEAIAAFEAQLEEYPQGQYAEDALFWLGETHYVTRDPAQALAAYDRLIAGHPQSPRLPGAMLKVGTIHAEQGRTEDARTVFEAIRVRYPNSDEARRAADRLARLGGAGR